jgi:hypothetical protein
MRNNLRLLLTARRSPGIERMSKVHKASPEELEPDRRTRLNPRHKRKAAQKIAGHGWRIEDGLPVCPSCFARRVLKGKYTLDDIA